MFVPACEQKEVAEGEQFFQRLVALAPAGVCLADAEGNCRYVNRRWTEMTGLAPHEALGRHWTQGIHVADLETTVRQWHEAVRSSGEWKLEYRVQTPQGRTTWVLGLGHALCDDHGGITGSLNFVVDIAERKEVVSKLQACERGYSELLLAARAYRYSVEISGGVPTSTEHSPGCIAMTGYRPEDYRSQPSLWIDMVHPEDRERVRQHAARIMQGEAVPPIEHRIQHRSGSIRWLRNTVLPHHDESGTLIGYDGLIEDITERRRADERLRSVLESAAIAMLLVNQEGRILFANSHTESVFGFTREEMLDQPLEILVPERFRDRHVAARGEYSRAPSVQYMCNRPSLLGRRKDNTEFAAEVALSPIETDEGLMVVAAVLDITQRKKTEEALRSNLEIQSALNALLKLSLDPLSLDELLEQALDLLLSLSWIRLGAKGSVFLVEDDPRVLVMKARRGLAEPLLKACCRVRVGECLCGLAAEQRDVVFACGVDERHRTRYPGMTPHGHYCIPIVSEDTLLGIINLYVEKGHERNPAEESFLTAVAAVLAGIVKRKRAEEALSRSEARFDLAVRGTDAGIWDWDLVTGKCYFSPRWKGMLGYDGNELESDFSEWEARLHPDDRERALGTIRDYLDNRTSQFELEHRLQHKNGSYRWMLARGAVVRDPSGKPVRMVGSHLDITDRKRSEQLMREREGELIAAQRIQQHLLPGSILAVPGYDIAGSLVPAQFAAGDYYDYLMMPDGSLGIVVGDVCGHGFSAALVMASVSAHLRSFVLDHTDIEEALRHVNKFLCRETEEGRFVTLLFVQLELASRRLKYLNLGHPSGYVLGRTGAVKGVLPSGALPLAILPDMDIPSGVPMELEAQDIVLLTTDGFFEARSPAGEPFGQERMMEAVRANRDRRASEIIQSLQQAVFDFTGLDEPQDDLTAVVIKVESELAE